MQGLKINVKMSRCGISMLAQFELSRNLLYICYVWVLQLICGKRWKKHQQMNSAWKSPLNSPGRKVFWSRFVWWSTGSWTWEQNTQSIVGNMTLTGQAVVCPPGILPLQEYFQGKGAETNLGNICIKGGGKEPKMSCLLELNLWQVCRSGFPLYERTRSWALQGLLERPAQAPWAQSDLQTFSQFLRTPSSPNSWH